MLNDITPAFHTTICFLFLSSKYLKKWMQPDFLDSPRVFVGSVANLFLLLSAAEQLLYWTVSVCKGEAHNITCSCTFWPFIYSYFRRCLPFLIFFLFFADCQMRSSAGKLPRTINFSSPTFSIYKKTVKGPSDALWNQYVLWGLCWFAVEHFLTCFYRFSLFADPSTVDFCDLLSYCNPESGMSGSFFQPHRLCFSGVYFCAVRL